MSLPTSSLHLPLLTPTLSIAKSPGRFGSPCRPRRKAIRKLIASRTLHSTLPATVVQRRFATPFNLPPPQLHQTMSHPMLASSASPTQPTVTRTPYKTQLLRPPRLSFDGYERVLLVSHHASSRTPPLAHIARKHCFCSLVANSAFRNAPSSSPNTRRANRRRSLKPKRPFTEPRRPIASPITVSTSTCQLPQLLIQLARPTPGQAIRVSPLPLSRSVLVPPPNAAAHPESNPSLTFPPSNTRPTSRRFHAPSAPRQGKIHPQRLRERIRERLRSRLRERIRQRLWQRGRQGQRQRQRKRKGLQITLAQCTSSPSTASHNCAWQRLRHIGAPACHRY